MSDLKCPYCKAEQDVNHDDGRGYEESRRHEKECIECGKTFVFTTHISFDYTPEKADCLNGSEHRLNFRKSWPHQYSRMCCQDCDYSRMATPDELQRGLARAAIKKVEQS
jgi:hypothetical protein